MHRGRAQHDASSTKSSSNRQQARSKRRSMRRRCSPCLKHTPATCKWLERVSQGSGERRQT
eukprot:11837298-Alexandrium_andersonii.AAC.1